tara:strand:+ start:212 stop:547 length:336 start_codon:yes stop_codon:yes gene_type:complete
MSNGEDRGVMGGDPLPNGPQSPEGLPPPPSSMTFNLKHIKSNQERYTRSSQQQSTRRRKQNNAFGKVPVEDESTKISTPTVGRGKVADPQKTGPLQQDAANQSNQGRYKWH